MAEIIEKQAISNDAAPERNYLDLNGAYKICKKIEEYWHKRGFKQVMARPYPIEERFVKVGTYQLYGVETNLVGGLPPQ